MRGVTIYQMNAGGPPTTILAQQRLPELHARRPHGGDRAQGRRDPRDPGRRRAARAATTGSRSARTSSTSRAPAACSSAPCATRAATARRARTTLLVERAEVLAQYDRSLEPAAGGASAPAASRRRELPGAARPSARRGCARVGARLVGAALHRGDPLRRRWSAAHPELQADVDLWRMERQSLLRRIAEPVGRDPQEVRAARRVRGVRADRRADRHARARAADPAVAFVSIGFFLFYYAVPGRRRGTREPADPAAVARDVARRTSCSARSGST